MHPPERSHCGRSLNASNNRITELHGLQQLQALEVLLLRSNRLAQLSAVDGKALLPARLLEVDVSGNRIALLGPAVASVSALRQLQSISAYGNPIETAAEYQLQLSTAVPGMRYLDGAPACAPLHPTAAPNRPAATRHCAVGLFPCHRLDRARQG